jgi:hypothetical protein
LIFWGLNSVSGLWNLIFAFLTPKSIYFLTPCKIPDRWTCHTIILILAYKSVFGLWRVIFAILNSKSIFFLAPCNLPDRWIYHTTILILGPKFRFWALGAYLRLFDPQKIYISLLHVKFPIDGYITRQYWFWAPNSVFGLWEPIFAFLTPKNILFLAPCKIPDRWIYHTTILILGPKFRFWAFGAHFRLFDLQKYIYSCSM